MAEREAMTIVETIEPKDITQLVTEHVSNPENQVDLNTEEHKCVDGRYSKAGRDRGYLAYPGADLGDALVLLTLMQQTNPQVATPEHAIEIVAQVRRQLGRKFSMHTDTHAEHAQAPGVVQIGCGAVAKPMDPANSKGYGIPAELTTRLVKYAQTISGDFNNTVLEGEHAEQAVVIVTGTKKTIDTFNPETGFQVFVYNQPVYEAYVRNELVPTINRADGLNINPDDWMAIHNKHLGKTLDLLADGKPIYQVNVDGPTPQVTYAGRVSQKADQD